jgi:hypothetical protein
MIDILILKAKCHIFDFSNYASLFYRISPQDMRKLIWVIGISRGSIRIWGFTTAIPEDQRILQRQPGADSFL